MSEKEKLRQGFIAQVKKKVDEKVAAGMEDQVADQAADFIVRNRGKIIVGAACIIGGSLLFAITGRMIPHRFRYDMHYWIH